MIEFNQTTAPRAVLLALAMVGGLFLGSAAKAQAILSCRAFQSAPSYAIRDFMGASGGEHGAAILMAETAQVAQRLFERSATDHRSFLEIYDQVATAWEERAGLVVFGGLNRVTYSDALSQRIGPTSSAVAKDFMQTILASAPLLRTSRTPLRRFHIEWRGPALGIESASIEYDGSARTMTITRAHDEMLSRIMSDLDRRAELFRRMSAIRGRRSPPGFSVIVQSLLNAAPRAHEQNDRISLAVLAGLYRSATGRILILDGAMPAMALALNRVEFEEYFDEVQNPGDGVE